MSKTAIQLDVNGVAYDVLVDPGRSLADVLRDDLGLTGTKRACNEGECGSCAVHLDGTVVNSCLVLAVEAVGQRITTIEGLSHDGTLDPLQQAFADHFASQCGYCTPGMIMTAKALLADNPKPTEDEIRQAIRGNLCRCTGYAKIVDAVLAASGQLEIRTVPPTTPSSVTRCRAPTRWRRSPARRRTPTTCGCPGCSTARSCGARSRTRAW